MSRIFLRISSWYSLIRRSASTSWAQRFCMIGTGPLPKMSFWKMSERLAWGSTEKRSTRLPWLASQKALVAESVVLPSPPLPPNMMYRRSGWLSNTARSDMGGPARPSAQHVRDVALAEHPALPTGDLRGHVRQEPEGVVRGEDRHAEQVAHRDQDEQVLHARSCAHGVASHFVR